VLSGEAVKNQRSQNYVIDLFEQILGEQALREHTFPWLRGDPTPKRPQGSPLRVDAFFPLSIVVLEIRESQHFRPHKFFDRRAGRREQRARYDRRREKLIPKHGLKLVIVREDHLSWEEERDKQRLRELLQEAHARASPVDRLLGG